MYGYKNGWAYFNSSVWKYNKLLNQPSFRSENIWTHIPFHSISLCTSFHNRCGASRGCLLMKRKVAEEGLWSLSRLKWVKKQQQKLCNRQKMPRKSKGKQKKLKGDSRACFSFLEFILSNTFHPLSDLNGLPGNKCQ